MALLLGSIPDGVEAFTTQSWVPITTILKTAPKLLESPRYAANVATIQVDKFLRNLMPRAEFEADLKAFEADHAKKRYKRLLGRVLMEVPEGTPITIIPDGILTTLPFEALVVEGSAHWNEKAQVPTPEGLTYVGICVKITIIREKNPPNPL